ncbi:hypothetical protein BMS92_08550 [Leuconostoc mesenteroides subsp. mesenteroides]|nr:hypothetical protein BMS92_08550 [Leuconostoc mesenteroides subsp. mesenteroides]
MKQLCCFKGLRQCAGQAWWPTLKDSDADNTIASLLFLTIKDDSKNFFNPQITNRGGKIANKPTGNPSSTLGGVSLSRHFYYGAKR